MKANSKLRMLKNVTRSTVALAIALAGVSGQVVSAQDVSKQPAIPSQTAAISDDQIEQLIADLDDDRFHVREAALRRLSEADARAIPRLADAAAEGSMEVVVRAISAMRNIATRDQEASATAQAELVRLSQPAYTLAGRHAQRALQELVVIEGERARSELLSLGATYGTGRNMDDGPPVAWHMEFQHDWRGSAEDFAKVSILHDLQCVSLVGANFDDEYFESLVTIPNLSRVFLYNTKFSDTAVAKLRARLGEGLDYRAGAKLGVTSNDGFAVRCIIISVVAGSAADKAGIMPGDVVVAADGTPIPDFSALNAIIAQKLPGDPLELEIVRGQRQLKVTATLDGW